MIYFTQMVYLMLDGYDMSMESFQCLRNQGNRAGQGEKMNNLPEHVQPRASLGDLRKKII
jgi:hypothetical protein